MDYIENTRKAMEVKKAYKQRIEAREKAKALWQKTFPLKKVNALKKKGMTAIGGDRKWNIEKYLKIANLFGLINNNNNVERKNVGL